MRSLTPLRSLALLVTVTFVVLFTLAPRYDLLEERATRHAHVARGAALVPRQSNPLDGITASASSPSTPSAQPSSTSTPDTPTSTSTSTSISTSTAAPTSQPTSDPASPTSSATPSSPTTPTDSPSASITASPTSQAPSVITSGSVIVTVTAPGSSSSTPSASSSAAADSNKNSSSISTSTIVGLSVAGGVAVLGIIGFFIWKFTRKRFQDLDDNEAIKWPELNNTHSDLPLPTHRTGGAGFGDDDDIVSRAPSRVGGAYAASVGAASTTELYPDPYAVPPLPHLNPAGGPGAPYRDDPDAQHFYDPYRGPVPQTFEGGVGPGGEAIPMTQLAGAGRRSPGPGVPFDGGMRAGSPAQGYAPYPGDSGRGSPASMAYGGRASPGPQAAYGYAPH